MSLLEIRSILLATEFALAGCGGGGGSGVASIPPPPPAPAPNGSIILAATTSQQFAAIGASHSFDGDQTPRLAGDEQLQVRYVASSNSYEVSLPHSDAWGAISYVPTGSATPINFEGRAMLWLRSEGYLYSSLFEWADGNSNYGHEAIGMATPASGIPVTGSASYSGDILGSTSERHASDDMYIVGSLALGFNFGTGTLSGSISPMLGQDFARHSLGTISFRDPVYSTGSATFSGSFDTNLAGLNSFSGLFTGPNAQELIGNFALPYRSPIDGQTYQADGAFVAKH